MKPDLDRLYLDALLALETVPGDLKILNKIRIETLISSKLKASAEYWRRVLIQKENDALHI